jgi:two-component system nitrate/nitrite response regulator NarL
MVAAHLPSARHIRDVAVVEADALFRDALRAAIDNGTGLRCVASGAHLDELGVNGSVEAVVIGASTPKQDVLRQAAVAKRRHPRAKVVVIAGRVDAELIDQVKKAAGCSVVSTDQPLDDLVTAIVGDREASEPRGHRQQHAEIRASELGLTRREREVLLLLADGRNVASIAYSLGISTATCRDHIKHLREKLHCQSAIEVVVTAFRLGLLPELNRQVS